MARKPASTDTIKSLKAQVKWKASPSFSVHLRSGIRSGKGPGVTFQLPIEARTLETDNHLYVSIPALVGMYRKDGRGLVEFKDDVVVPGDLAAEMEEAMKSQAKAGKAKAPAVQLPADLLKKLGDAVPAGYKLAVKDGEVTLVKARVKTSKK